MVPHLTTALNGPLLSLEKNILDAMPKVEHWFRTQWLQVGAPFYASVDLRNAGFKLAPVDTNLFPAGFNNLNPDFLPLCVQAAMTAIEKVCPEARRLLVIPENHTRNTYYLRNMATLTNILRQAGLEVRIGTLSDEIQTPTEIDLQDGQRLLLEPVRRQNNRLLLADFDSCAILLNNDLSAGLPEILRGLEQNLIPPLHAGWYTRRKSTHFSCYDQVSSEFASMLGIDQWLINPYFEQARGLDFQAHQGETQIAEKVALILDKTREKYREYGVEQAPYVIIKADAGTYGMGIMRVRTPEEVIGLNRKQRNKMAVVKEGLEVHEVIIQEGVYTFESINDAVAEPVVYMMDRYVVGGFYRVHTGRDVDENLNAPGMHFVPLAFDTPCSTPDCADAPDARKNRFYAYGVVARLALLAAALELQQTDPSPV